MKFVGLTPDVFGAMFGAIVLVLGLLYLIKLRRRRVTVPFSPIWSRVVASRQANRWWERLKRLLSFLLMLLMMGLVLSAIADPRPEDEREFGRQIVLLMDTSASMSALDVSGGVDRLDVARQAAVKILKTMGPLDVGMLVTMDGQLRPLTPFVKEPALLEQTLKDVKVKATPANIQQAMQFVRDAVIDRPRAEVYVMTDGVFEQDFKLAAEMLPKTAQFKHIKVGESGSNVAITAFNVRRYVSNKLNYEIYLELKNYFKRSIEVEVKLSSDGELVEKKRISLDPEASRSMFFPNEGFEGVELEARVVVVTEDARDVFPLDDRAFAQLPKTRKVSVLAVIAPDGQGAPSNLFLEAPLVSNNNVSYTTILPGAWSEEAAKGYDVVIFDRFTPPEVPEEGNYMYIAPEGEGSPWPVVGELDSPEVTKTVRRDPLMRWLTFQDANISVAQRLKKGRRDKVAAMSGANPILISRRDGNLALVGLAFDLRRSELPLKYALPVLMLNVFDYFMEDGESIVPSYETGEAWSIPVSKESKSATITSPDGVKHQLPVYQGKAIFYGEQVGFHQVEAGDETFKVAANLSNDVESRIQPSEELLLEDREMVFKADADKVKHQAWWKYLVFGALALLMLEWTTYNRRWTV